MVGLMLSQMQHNIVEHCERPKLKTYNSPKKNIRDADKCRKEIQDIFSLNYVAIQLHF